MAAYEDQSSAEQAGKNHSYVSDRVDDRSSTISDDGQAGVKHIEAISQTWTKWSLVVAYLGYVPRLTC